MNWAELVQKIQDHALSQPEIADFCGCSQPQICRLLTKKRGKRISFDLSTKIIEMKELIEAGELTKR